MLIPILVAEISFFTALMLGLVCRYALGWRTVSTILLASTPLIDLVIVILTYVDLANGAVPDITHGLAAFYVGFSVVFGPDIIKAIDSRVPRSHKQATVDERARRHRSDPMRDWKRSIVAGALTLAILAVGIVVTGWGDSFWLIYWMIVVVFTVLAWGYIGPVRSRLKAKGA